MAERNDTGAGEGCKVHDVFWFVVVPAFQVIESTNRPSASVLSTSMVLPESGDDIAWSLSVGGWHVFCHAGDSDDFTGVATGCQGFHGSNTIADPHIVLHFVHVRTGFSEMPPVSKVIPFPTSMGCCPFWSPLRVKMTMRVFRDDPMPTYQSAVAFAAS